MLNMAKQLIGRRVQKVETTRRGLVVAVKPFLPDLVMLVFEDGYQGGYQAKDIRSMLVDGTHHHNCE